LTKRSKYYYDQDLIKEDSDANKRSVWTVNTENFSDAHFAVFPGKLIEPCILAGCPKEVCLQCGEPKKMLTSKKRTVNSRGPRKYSHGNYPDSGRCGDVETKPAGYSTCDCKAGFISGTVLDPFMGAFTTGIVAERYGRKSIGFELSPEYCDMSIRRWEQFTGKKHKKGVRKR